jgi:5-hydroxyisourate hydrolase
VSTVTTHVLDTARGTPARGIAVRLESLDGTLVGKGRTDDDGRVRELGPERLAAGTYRIVFEIDEFYAASGEDAFFPEVVVTFTVPELIREQAHEHLHIPLLLSPYAYSTYRGS